MSEQPRTAAGRALHKGEMFDLSNEEDRRRLALAIEAEAAAEPDGAVWTDEQYVEYGAHQYRRGRAQAEAEATAAVPLDVERLEAAALNMGWVLVPDRWADLMTEYARLSASADEAGRPA